MSHWTRRLILVVLAAALQAIGPANAAQYVVDGFALGERIAPDDPNYRSYACQPSGDYDDAIECTRQVQKKGQAGKLNVSSAIIHAVNGATLYAAVHAAPVKLTRKALTKELADLTRVIGAPPTSVTWSPDDSGGTTSVIATWGAVSLTRNDGYDLHQFPRLGAFVDFLGDPQTSAEQYSPVYRLSGQGGYVYAASFDGKGIGERYYVAVNPENLARRHYRSEMRPLLAKDKALAADDFSLWPDVAMATRNLALATSPAAANRELDAVFDKVGSDKLRSHVWAILPTGAIQRLGLGRYWRFDVYGPRTSYPEVRRNAEDLIAAEPNDRFIAFAHFLLGDFDGALQANPDSVIANVLNYAAGFQTVQDLVDEALKLAANRAGPAAQDDTTALGYLLQGDPADPDPNSATSFSVNDSLSFVNQNGALFDNQPLSALLPDFGDRAAQARAHFAAVSGSTTLGDDAAYMGAWVDQQSGDLRGALSFISKGMAAEDAHADDDDFYWTDYQGAMHEAAVQIMEGLPPDEQVPALQSDHLLGAQHFLWYAIARAAYRKFDYARTIDLGQTALDQIGIPVDQLPATTDRDQIVDAIERLDPQLTSDLNVVEMPYLIEASREMGDYEDALANLAAQDPTAFASRAQTLIIKYSLLVDRPPGAGTGDDSPEHQDFRQALHLIDTTLDASSANPAYSGLRQWLYYRKVRILAVSQPQQVGDAVAQLEAEFPSSQLLDDALAEEIFADGIELRDVDAAQQTFAELLQRAPRGNAVDNAYSWMEIILRCEGDTDAADRINSDILRLFPFTRHAKYALERNADPDRFASGCGDDFF